MTAKRPKTVQFFLPEGEGAQSPGQDTSPAIRPLSVSVE